MSKWKCEICGKEFDNFHAQGFDNKIYCPLCFFKEENRRLKDKINTYENPEDLTLMFMYCDEKAKDKIKQLKEKRDLAVQKANEEREKNVDLEIELDKYKEVIEEVREHIETQKKKPYKSLSEKATICNKYNDLLKILDKVKENK